MSLQIRPELADGTAGISTVNNREMWALDDARVPRFLGILATVYPQAFRCVRRACCLIGKSMQPS